MKNIFLIIFSFIISSSAYAATKHDIAIKKFKFSPAEITIEAGDTIRWTNKEKRQYHSVWFKQLGEPEPDYFFPDEFYEKTFDETGEFPYLCGPHPRMTGIVHVTADGKEVLPKEDVAKSSSKSSEKPESYLVEAIEDGDTVVINLKGKSQRIQLSGIDAPENTENSKLKLDVKNKKLSKKGLFEIGKLATDFLKTKVAVDQKVTLKGDLTQQDKYGRIPAIVINEAGESLNELMIREGYAVVLKRYPLEDTFKEKLEKAELQAITDKTGLWKTHYEITTKWSGR